MSDIKDLKIINLTPHTIRYYQNDQMIAEYPPHETSVRLQSNNQYKVRDYSFNGTQVPVVSPPSFNPKIEWPEGDYDAVLVSMPVGQTVHNNDEHRPPFHVFGPDTGPNHVVRDENGNILGTTRFIEYTL